MDDNHKQGYYKNDVGYFLHVTKLGNHFFYVSLQKIYSMKKTIAYCILLLQMTAAFAQEKSSLSILNKIIPPSPQAAALARYGEYPVGHTSGVPQIDIPLYEIKVGDYTLPISISYHASGIKVDDVASTVGLGWVLNAGGVITRTIKGRADLQHASRSINDTLYHSNKRVDEIIDEAHESGGNVILLENIINRGSRAEYDLESDRYCYNFANKTGIFRYSYEKNDFVVLNYEPLYICANGGDNSRFEILDTDGILYIFEAREYVGLVDDENRTHVSSWYLSEIMTPSGNMVFEYMNEDDYYTHSLSESVAFGYFADYTDGPEDAKYYYGGKSQKTYAHYLHRTLLLSRISWNGNRIEFIYNKDRKDIVPQRLSRIEIIGCDNQIYKTVSFNNDSYIGYNPDNYRMMLKSISISDEGKYSFLYHDTLRLPDYFRSEDDYDGVTANSNSTTDYWGYYNGTNTRYYVSAEVMSPIVDYYSQIPTDVNETIIDMSYYIEYGANKTPNLIYAQTGTLRSIEYPTGGHTSFTYELNHLGRTLGGLRIKKISQQDYNGNINERSFNYISGYATQDLPHETMVYTAYHNYRLSNAPSNTYTRKVCVSDPLVPLCDNSGAPAFYTTIEENITGNGKIIYEYINSNIYNFLGTSASDCPQVSPSNLNDQGFCRPYLSEKRIYDNSDRLVYTESYEYEKKELATTEIGTQLVSVVTRGTDTGVDLPLTSEIIYDETMPHAPIVAHSTITLLKKKTTTDNLLNISTTEDYTYDSQYRNLKPRTISVTGSDGNIYKTEYEYTFNRLDSRCDSMANLYGILDPIIGTKQYCNDILLSTERIEYMPKSETDWFYPQYIKTSLQDAALTEDLHFAEYDSNGNILTLIEKTHNTIALVWGYNSYYPVAQVKGCSYAHLKALPGMSSLLENIATCCDPMTMAGLLSNFRSKLPNGVLATTYVYRPLFGPSAITNENGYTRFYDYHSNGKLAAIRDSDGTIQTFDYNYVNPYSE